MAELFSVKNMTKEGLLKKFFTVFGVIVVLALGATFMDSNNAFVNNLLGGLFIAGYFGFIPAVIIAFLWEFFSGASLQKK